MGPIEGWFYALVRKTPYVNRLLARLYEMTDQLNALSVRANQLSYRLDLLLDRLEEPGSSRIDANSAMTKQINDAAELAIQDPPSFPVPPPEKLLDHLAPGKQHLLDYACQRYPIHSLADLGGVWGSDGGYTFYAMETYGVPVAFLVDFVVTKSILKRAERHRGLKVLTGHFTAPEIVGRVGRVDAVLLFDVLVAQAEPAWEKVLEAWAGHTTYLLISNPIFVNEAKSIRLTNLSRDDYFECVPHTPRDPGYRDFWEDPDKFMPEANCKARDWFGLWQWGLSERDLLAKMDNLGFRLDYRARHQRWKQIKREVVNFGFVFVKNE